jgi:hypothetical protein
MPLGSRHGGGTAPRAEAGRCNPGLAVEPRSTRSAGGTGVLNNEVFMRAYTP